MEWLDFLHPFKCYITPFIQDYFDWVSLFNYTVLVPEYVDAKGCNFDEAPQLDLGWRLRRHIRRVESKLRARGRHPAKFPTALQTPEPPPFIDEHW